MSEHKHSKEDKKKPLHSPKEKKALKQQKKHEGETTALLKKP
ncbi:MAG: hypothetical protein ABI440_09425 [Casimicrobiaceae bacterium]